MFQAYIQGRVRGGGAGGSLYWVPFYQIILSVTWHSMLYRSLLYATHCLQPLCSLLIWWERKWLYRSTCPDFTIEFSLPPNLTGHKRSKAALISDRFVPWRTDFCWSSCLSLYPHRKDVTHTLRRYCMGPDAQNLQRIGDFLANYKIS